MDFSQSWSNLKWICIWFAIIFGALSLVLAIVVAVKHRDRFAAFLKAWFFTLVTLATVAAVYAFVLTCREMVAEGELIPQLFYPIGATMLWAILGFIALQIIYAVKPFKVRVAGLIWSAGFAAGLAVTIGIIAKYYVDVIQTSGYYENVSTIALAVGAAILAAALISFGVFFGRKTDKSEHTRSIVYAGVSVALSFALSYVTFFKMPQGGSITLASMLPILVYGYRFGTRRGIIAGLVYGLLQAVQDPWIIHPAQFLLDYPLAFAMLGLAGWLRTLRPKGKDGNLVIFLVGGVTAVILRYFAHVISGIFAFSSYAAEGYSAVAWGFLYNTFCLVDGAICLSLGALLYLNRGVRRLIFGDSAASSSSAGPEKSVASPVPESVDSSAPSSASSSASESADSTTALQ